MKMWFLLGLRNILKNRRRSFFTLGAIAFGFAAVNAIGGFTSYIFSGLEDSYVYASGNGHLTIFKKGFQAMGSLEPAKYLLEDQDIQIIESLYHDDPRILSLSPGLTVTGLLSNGETSAIMTAEGRIPSATAFIRSLGRGVIGSLKMFEGSDLKDENPTEVGIARGLAGKLGLKTNPPSSAIALSPTVDGFMNALDVKVVQFVDAPIELLDEIMMSVPLDLARRLYDTKGADRLIVLLAKPADLHPMVEEMSARIAAAGLEVEILTWEQLRPSYLRIRGMFTVIFTFVFIVVLVIVGMSVINTVSTAVLERTREIGTLRALGLKRKGTIAIFGTESALLALLGSTAGLVLTLIIWFSIRSLDLTWIPPNIPKRVPLEIYLVPGLLLVSFVSLVALAVVAAAFPARRAALMQITDALGHI